MFQSVVSAGLSQACEPVRFSVTTQQMASLARHSSQVRGQPTPEAVSWPICPPLLTFSTLCITCQLIHISIFYALNHFLYPVYELSSFYFISVFTLYLSPICPAPHQPPIVSALVFFSTLAAPWASNHIFLSLLSPLSPLGVDRTAFSHHSIL